MSDSGHRFLAHRCHEWYAVCRSERLRGRPLAVELIGVPLVLFRGRAGKPGALIDRCPHRNVPLSLGRVRAHHLQCVYHGWEFDAEGICQVVPGLVGDVRGHERRAGAYAARESQGFVWVYGEPGATPQREPFQFPHAGEPGYTSAREELDVKASLHATAENALDVPHTAFLHGGLFRSESRARREIDVIVRRGGDYVEADYVGEARPPGVVAKLLAPKGGDVTHVDRFVLPSIVQVEYRMGESHLSVSAALTPSADYRTHLCVMFSFRLPFPGWMVARVLRPFALRVFGQDAWMLSEQTATIDRFGEENYKFTEIDVLGSEIFDLLRHGRGETKPERRIRMLV